MMAQSRAESTRDIFNYGQYINQFLPNTIKAIRLYEWIQKKICRQKMSIMFNEICIYIYIYVMSMKENTTDSYYSLVNLFRRAVFFWSVCEYFYKYSKRFIYQYCSLYVSICIYILIDLYITNSL